MTVFWTGNRRIFSPSWRGRIEKARRYVTARAALDLIETAALLKPAERRASPAPAWPAPRAVPLPEASGETITIELDEGEHRFFAAACLESRTMTTNDLTIPAGDADAEITVRTDYNGDRKLEITAELN